MTTQIVSINAERGVASLVKACRLWAALIQGHGPALAKASGIYERQIYLYAEPQAFKSVKLRQPNHTLDRLLDAVLATLPPAEAQRRLALVAHHYAAKAGGSFVPGGHGSHGSLDEEIAEQTTAATRTTVAVLRAKADGRITRNEAEEIAARGYEEMQETGELITASVQAAMGGR